ncbi:MAG TPA: SDR family oxidoreductase [Acidimicrobiales bacterium]|nr:SDR family oxidoreductase [Acidimicrobiales bacterium]
MRRPDEGPDEATPVTAGKLLDGQVAVVTGAGRGIGRALALRLAADGATLVVSSRTRSELEGVLAEAEACGAGPGSRAVVADALDRDGARAPVAEAVAAFGRVDVLVGNVGGRALAGEADGDPYTCPDEVFEELVTLNLVSQWWAVRAALPSMRARGYGRIVLVGSGSAHRAGGSAGYAAAKHGVVGLTRSLAVATGQDGITVNCLSPGWTLTGHNDWAAIGRRHGVVGPDEGRRWAESENAQRRILEPDELGGMLRLLVSPDGAGITGQELCVDGGYKL